MNLGKNLFDTLEQAQPMGEERASLQLKKSMDLFAKLMAEYAQYEPSWQSIPGAHFLLPIAAYYGGPAFHALTDVERGQLFALGEKMRTSVGERMQRESACDFGERLMTVIQKRHL